MPFNVKPGQIKNLTGLLFGAGKKKETFLKKETKMFQKIFHNRQYVIQGLFSDHFVDVKVFYVAQFNKVPSVAFIGELDVTPAFAFLRGRLEQETKSILQHSFYDHTEQKMFFNNSIFVLENSRMVEVAGNYCQVLHAGNQHEWAAKTLKDLAQFRLQPLAEEGPATVIGFARQTTLN